MFFLIKFYTLKNFFGRNVYNIYVYAFLLLVVMIYNILFQTLIKNKFIYEHNFETNYLSLSAYTLLRIFNTSSL